MKLFHKKKKSVSIQEHSTAEDKPDKEEIDRQFDMLLDELAIPNGVKRDEMQNWDLPRKWMLLSQKSTPETPKRIVKVVSTKNIQAEDNPQSYIIALKSPQREKHLASLKVILTGKELSWAIVFLDLNGLECILDILEDSVRATPKTALRASEILDCIACIKALLNSQIGMAKCMERPQFTKAVASVLSCTEELVNPVDVEMWEKIMCSALNILAAMCIIPTGHRMVIAAFNRLCEEFGEEERFACILKCIWHCVSNAKRDIPLTENYYSLLLSCMSFINVVINAPYELRMRCALRSSILAIGGEIVLQELRGIKDDTIQAQLDTFNSTAEDDCAELVGDKGLGDQLVSELTQSLVKKAKPNTHQSIFFILNNLNYILSKDDLPTCEFSLRELESQSHQVLLQLLYTANHDAEEWVHIKAVSDPTNHATAVATLPWMPNSLRTRRNTVIARQIEEPEFTSSPGYGSLDCSPHLGPPSPPPVEDESPPESLSPSARTRFSAPPALSIPSDPLIPPPHLYTPPFPSPHFASSPSMDYPLFPSSPSSSSSLPPPSSSSSSLPPPSSSSSESPRCATPPPADSSSLTSPALASSAPPTPSSSTRPTSSSSSPPTPSSIPPAPPQNGGPPPPPPSLPVKKYPDTQFMPGVKMRNLQWKKVNENMLQNTIWGQAEFQNSGASSLLSAADYKALEELFGENNHALLSPRSVQIGTEETNGEVQPEPPKKPAKISLIDPKRSNNIAIMISKIKISPAEIAAAVEDMDSSKLTSDQVGQMLKLLPTPEETTLLASVSEEDKLNLGKPELYLLEIMRIPNLNIKLECWHFSLTFAARVAELKMNTVTLTNASKQLTNSKKFSQLLLVILQLGNFMNAGGFRGSAAGVKLDCLNKLRELKSSDKRQTLLHFLVNFCLSKQPELVSFFEEISFTEDARNISMQGLQADYTALCTGFTNLEKYVLDLANDPFAQKLSGITAEAKSVHEGIKTEFAAAKAAYESTLAFFGEEPVSPEEFFGNIFRFHASFTQVISEINRTNQKGEKRGTTPVHPLPAGGGQYLDNIITKIHNSKIFKNRTNYNEIMVSSITPRSLFVAN